MARREKEKREVAPYPGLRLYASSRVAYTDSLDVVMSRCERQGAQVFQSPRVPTPHCELWSMLIIPGDRHKDGMEPIRALEADLQGIEDIFVAPIFQSRSAGVILRFMSVEVGYAFATIPWAPYRLIPINYYREIGLLALQWSLLNGGLQGCIEFLFHLECQNANEIAHRTYENPGLGFHTFCTAVDADETHELMGVVYESRTPIHAQTTIDERLFRAVEGAGAARRAG